MATSMITPLYMPQAPIVHLAAEMKKAVDIPVITVGALNVELGEKALKDGHADIVAFGRALVADAELPNKVAEDRLEDIRPCCRGHEGCITLFFAGCPIRCEVNPQCGRELEYKVEKAAQPKNVVVIGGGVAGMEAARLASEIGHTVTLLEKTDKLGGHFIEGTAAKFKIEAKGTLDWLIRQVAKSKARVVLGKEATPELVASYHPDAVIIATGSHYKTPPIKGIEKANLPDETLLHPDRTGAEVVVIGGGLIGSETALSLTEYGKTVTLVEMLEDIAMEDEPLSQTAIKLRLQEENVAVHTHTRVTEVTDNGIRCINAEGTEFEIPAQTIVAATGLNANQEAAAPFAGIAPKTFKIGDAVQARKIFQCFHEAWHAVLNI